jgi:membrane protein YdbS with pleckstrin-like domain
MITQNWVGASNAFVPAYTVTVSIIGFLFVDAYRRTHKYIITSQRIRLKGGIFTKRERILSHDKILDLTTRQGILGQIFDFGTITPITQHEFIHKGEKFLKLEAIKSKKKKAKQKDQDDIREEDQLQTSAQKSYYELHGVYPYKEVKKIVEELLQGTPAPTKSITTYQQEQRDFKKQQLDIQKEMKGLLATQTTKKTKKQQSVVAAKDEEEENEEEAFQPEQLDIQKEMKELLKKQGETKEEEIDEEETETEEKS